MSLDPAVSEFLAAHPPHVAGSEAPPAERRAVIRTGSDRFFTDFSEPAVPVHSIDEALVPVDGGEIRVRIYRPDDRTELPVHVYLHGGGWWLGSIDELVVDATCRDRSVGAECVVVAVEYRLAPEHRFPVPLEDCCHALLWVAEHAGEFGGDAGNLSIGGTSAGANLAAAVSIAMRDRGGPRLRLQLLEVPPLDLGLGQVARSTVADDYGITRADLRENAKLYLDDPAEVANPLASPLLATDLTGLPPATIMTAEHDPLCVDGEAYAQRLLEAGVPVDYRCYAGATHGSLLLTATWESARQWRRDLIADLRRAHRAADELAKQR